MTPIEVLNSRALIDPAGIAFRSDEDVWTNGRLAGDVARLARGLIARGVRPGDRVALHMANIPELVVAYYACFRAN